MFGGVAFMVRGHMAAGIVGDSLMVRVAADDADVFLKEAGARLMDFSGRPMKGFLYVDAPGIPTARALQKWLGRAAAHAESQPVKVKKRKN